MEHSHKLSANYGARVTSHHGLPGYRVNFRTERDAGRMQTPLRRWFGQTLLEMSLVAISRQRFHHP